MTAQGARTASKVVLVKEHVMGLASYRVWYAAGYVSAKRFRKSAGSTTFERLNDERILLNLRQINKKEHGAYQCVSLK